MPKINKLTPEQEKQLPLHREKWLKIGLSTDQINKRLASQSVVNLYEVGGEKTPTVLFFDSPAQCCLAINILRSQDNLGDNLMDNLMDNLRDNLWANLKDNLGANLRDNLRVNLKDNLWANLMDNLRDNLMDNLRANLWANLGANLGANLRDNLMDNLGANLRANLGANLRANLMANLRDNLMDNLWDNLMDNLGDNAYISTSFWGGLDAYWLAVYEFGEKIGVKYSEQNHFDAYKEYAKNCGWGYFYKGAAFVSDRPCEIHKDENNRLHNESGPALLFRDGYGVYCWHGVNVPAHWIEDKDDLDPNEVLRVESVEQRAAGCQIIGWEKMLDHLDYKIIDSDPDPMHGDLIELTLSGLPEPEWYLRFECPRNGTMMEGVNKRELSEPTVFAAQAWKSPLPDHLFNYPKTRS